MNSVISKKYGLSPEEVETRSLSDEKFRALFNFHRIEKTRQVHERLNRYNKKIYRCKRKKVRDKLNIVVKVLVLAEKIKKYLRWENFISCWYKIPPILTETRFSIRKRQTIKISKNNKYKI